jgi:hypothetical protein
MKLGPTRTLGSAAGKGIGPRPLLNALENRMDAQYIGSTRRFLQFEPVAVEILGDRFVRILSEF